jgi:hypothetical protein
MVIITEMPTARLRVLAALLLQLDQQGHGVGVAYHAFGDLGGGFMRALAVDRVADLDRARQLLDTMVVVANRRYAAFGSSTSTLATSL